ILNPQNIAQLVDISRGLLSLSTMHFIPCTITMARYLFLNALIMVDFFSIANIIFRKLIE
ncbi:hypothetical protein EAY04_21840, partial [Vibrio anguillarum]|uniref:hypothetical protein n=1 Tax=Vibrio anguillarum TaxID=55601 RepID=UPI001BE3F6F3